MTPAAPVTQLYHIEYDPESSMLKAVFHRNEHDYPPTLDEKYNFRFFVNVYKNQDLDKADGELILEVKKFYALMHTDLIDQEEEYLLMRWNSGFD